MGGPGAWILILSSLVSGCFLPVLEAARGVDISNDTTTAVDVFYSEGGPSKGHLEPQQSRIFEFDLQPGIPGRDCTFSDIVAKAADGTVVARVAAPVCVDRRISLAEWLAP
jgi:hypothetical protein